MEAKNITVVTKAYIVRDRKFTIVRYEAGEKIYYGAIEDKYITNGILNARLSGAQLKQSDSVEEVLKRVDDEVEMNWLEEQGMEAEMWEDLKRNFPEIYEEMTEEQYDRLECEPIRDDWDMDEDLN